MSNPRVENLIHESRWDRSGWFALSFALILLFYNGIQVWRILQVPSDGWVWEDDNRTSMLEITFTSQVIGPPSPIQPYDQLISIQGESVADLVGKQFLLKLSPPPDWPDGTVLEYMVEREGQIVRLAIPVRRYSFGELLTAGLRLQGLPGVLQLAGSTFFFVVGVIVFLLRPWQRAAHALLILGTSFLFNSAPTSQWATTFFYPFRPISVPFDTWIMGINPSLMLMALAFPLPKWPICRFPRLTTLFLYLWAPLAINIAYLLNLGNPPGYFTAANVVYMVQILLLFILVFGSLIHSIFRVHEPVARNQLKWIGLGLASFIVPGVGGWLLGYIVIGFRSEIVHFVSVLGWFILPICLAIAITRYRLFDIDLIIRKTLQYTVLTGLLALIYFGSVVLLQNLFENLTGQGSPIVIVLSTLAIAALFNPLRQRVQRLIDRRFFRRKFNAEQTLANFAAVARDEVDMQVLTAAMLGVVAESMQPDSVSLWLGKGTGFRSNRDD
jgi:hypothetical protein